MCTESDLWYKTVEMSEENLKGLVSNSPQHMHAYVHARTRTHRWVSSLAVWAVAPQQHNNFTGSWTESQNLSLTYQY